MASIRHTGDPVLRGKAREVLLKDISSPKIKRTIDEMKKALPTQDNSVAVGVAIAAPQIGVPLRIFIVSGVVFQEEEEKESKKPDDLVCINPIITKRSKQKQILQEGCLSVPDHFGTVTRPAKVTLSAYDERGKKFERGASGLLAQIFQHEVDHLDGILFTDHAKDVREIHDPEESKKRKK